VISDTAPGAPADALAAGARIGRFVIEGVLGSGGMGVVYAARDNRLDRTIAIKLVRGGGRSEHARARLLDEARAMARISDPGVVPVFDAGELGDDVYIAMEHLRGGTLRTWMERQRPWRDVATMLLAAGRGLAAAHAAGLVHRDFKPENVLLGGDGRPRVSDFGLARDDGVVLRDDGNPVETHLAGTPAYMAPEQHLGRAADARSDQFSFCVVLWEAVYGERPFHPTALGDAATFEALAAAVIGGRITGPPPNARVPRRLEAILRRGLAVDPGARWPSVSAVVDEVEQLVRRRARSWLALAGAGALAGASILVLRPTGEATPVVACGARHTVTEVWNVATRDAYLARPGNAGFAGEDAAAFAGYAVELETTYAAACAATPRDANRIACLDGALDDLRTALVRRTRQYWPRLRAIDLCGTTVVEQDLGPVIGGETMLLSPDATVVLSQTWTAEPRLRDLRGGGTRPITGMRRALQWLADGTIAGLDKGWDVFVVKPGSSAGRHFPVEGLITEISPGLRYVAIADDPTVVVGLGGQPPTEAAPLRLRARSLRPVSFSPDDRYVASFDDVISVHDVTTRASSELAVRAHLRKAGVATIEWLDGRSLVFNGDVTDGMAADLWRLELDPGGRIAGMPRVMVRGMADTATSVYDVKQRRLLARRARILPRKFVLGPDGTTTLPGTMTNLTFTAISSDGAIILAKDRDGRWYRVATRDWTLSPLAGLDAAHCCATFRGTHIAALSLDAKRYVELDDSGTLVAQVSLQDLPWAPGPPTLACRGTDCNIAWLVGARVHIATIGAAGIGTSRHVDLQIPPGNPLNRFAIDDSGERIIATFGPAGERGSPVIAVHDRNGDRWPLKVDDAQLCQHAVFNSPRSIAVVCLSSRPGWMIIESDFDRGTPPRVRWRGDDWVESVLPIGDGRLLVSATSSTISASLIELTSPK
jgi:hypothetical protein